MHGTPDYSKHRKHGRMKTVLLKYHPTFLLKLTEARRKR